MKKSLIFLAVFTAAFIPTLILTGCPTPGGAGTPGGPGATKPPTHVALTGAKGLFLQTGTASKGLRAISKAAGSTTMLMQVMAGAQVGPATFTASDGSTVNVNIDAVLQVNASWLLVTYDTGGAQTTAAVSMSTGAMAPLAQVPNYFQQVRMLGSMAYFESGTTLYKTDFSSGAETAIGSGLAGNEYLHVTPSGNVYAYGVPDPPGQTFPWAMIFHPDGTSHGFENPGVPTVDKFGLFGNSNIVEDQNAGDMWMINWLPPNITAAKFVFDDYTGIPGTPAAIGVPLYIHDYIAGRLGEQVFFQGAVFIGNQEAAQIASDGSGGITVTQWDTSAVPQNDYLVNGQQIAGFLRYQTDGVSIYSAPCTMSQTINLVELPPGGGTTTDPVLVSDPGITSWAVVGGQVLYTDSSGTYQQATTVGASASLYSTTPVSLTPIGQ